MAVRLKKLGAALSRDLDVAVAVAREEILEAHTTQLLELIELSRDRVAPQRITEIYIRLHYLQDSDAAVVRNRALASLGLRSRETALAQLVDLPLRENGAEAPRGPLRFLRDRFRGRVHNDLRRWIELHTGRAEMIILDVHVHNALNFVKILSDQAPITDAVQLYREMVGARESLSQMLYWMVLARLSQTDLPDMRIAVSVDSENGGSNGGRRSNGRRAAAARTPYRTF